MARGAPKCGKCGLHPRSREHVTRCNPAAQLGSTGGRRKAVLRRGPREVAPTVDVVLEKWVLGKTCLACKTIYTSTPMPSFQSAEAKHGHYDVTKQLPGTSPDYPFCEACLPWHWRTEAKRLGMEKEVAEVYAGYFD